MLMTGGAFFLIPCLPELIEVIRLQEGLSQDNEDLNNKASGIFNAFYSFGAIIAPIIGGMLSDSIGYRSTNDAAAFLSITFLFFYAFTNTKLSDYKWKKVPKSVVKETDSGNNN